MMESSNNIIVLSRRIQEAIEVSMNPMSSKLERQEATKVNLEFMQNSPLCGDVGLYFFKNKELNTTVRMCGLQILGQFIRSKWNELDDHVKTSIKKEVVDMVYTCDQNEPSFIKEGLVKVFVEVVKRTWPQEWETLLSDLSGLQSIGDAQLEIVMKIFHTMSDDIHNMDDKIKAQRRKDMLITLNTHMDGLFTFFFGTLRYSATKLATEPTKANIIITKATLETITSFCTWVSFEHILSKDNLLLQTLLLLLENNELKLLAAECMSTIFERKVQYEERLKMMILLSDDALKILVKSARSANGLSKNDGEEYTFLKKINNALTEFGVNQISNLWGDDKGFKDEPAGFSSYVQLLLEFTQHDSLYIVTNTLRTWNSFYANEAMKKNKVLRKAMDQLLDILTSKIMKDTDPFSANSSEASLYNLYDFSDEDEYKGYFHSSRSAFSNLLEHLIEISPGKVLYNALVQLNNCLAVEPPDVSNMSMQQIMETKYYTALETLSFYCKHSVQPVLEHHIERITPEMLAGCNTILKKVLDYKCEVVDFRLHLLKTIDTLFCIFKVNKEHLLETVQMLFTLITEVVDPNSGKKKIQLQRQACFAFTSICKTIPETLCEIYEELEPYIFARLEEKHLTNHEKGVLLEGLLRISTKNPDKEIQKSFMIKVTSFLKDSLTRELIQNALKSPDGLSFLLGIHEGEHTEQTDQELSRLLLTIHSWSAITKACVHMPIDQIPEQPPDQDIEASTTTSPWIQPMIQILPQIFCLAEQYCMVWKMKDKYSLTIQAVLESHYTDVKLQYPENTVKPNRNFGRGLASLQTIYAVLYAGIVNIASCHGPLLYSLPGLCDVIIQKMVTPWTCLPTNKLGKIWRSFISSFVKGCPLRFYDVNVAPLLGHALPLTFEKLNADWQEMKDILANKPQLVKSEKQETETEEIKKINLLDRFTEHFISAVCSMLLYRRSYEAGSSQITSEGIEFGNLGKYIITQEGLSTMMMQVMFTALTWNSSGIVSRISNYILPIINTEFNGNSRLGSNIVDQLFILIIQAIEIHGRDQHVFTSLTTIAFHFYVKARLQFPSLVRIMIMIPGCADDKLKEFDLNYFGCDQVENVTEKRRKKVKAQFKNLIEGARGEDLSMLYRENIVIKDLPRLPKREKESRSLLNSKNEDIVGLTQLFGT
eukprot:TCONS_00017362-protein